MPFISTNKSKWTRLLVLPSRPLLRTLSVLYYAFFLLHRLLSRRTFLKNSVLISVGNISSGGSGKTPLVAEIANILGQRSGQIPAILMRGYRGAYEHKEILIDITGLKDRRLTQPKDTIDFPGDEAQMYIQKKVTAILGLGKKRSINAERLAAMGVGYMILDDGMQHHSLHRDFELVVIDSRNPDHGGLIPLGLAREPLCALNRADAIFLSRWQECTRNQQDKCMALIKPYSTKKKKIIRANHQSGQPYPLAQLNPELQIRKHPSSIQPIDKVNIVCAIASPQSFAYSTQALDLTIMKSTFFPDHYEYKKEDITKIAQENNFPIITTEKDAVKMINLFSKQLHDKHDILDSQDNQFATILHRIWVLPIEFKIDAADQAIFDSLIEEIITLGNHLAKYRKL